MKEKERVNEDMIRGWSRQDKKGWRGKYMESRQGRGVGRRHRFKTLIWK